MPLSSPIQQPLPKSKWTLPKLVAFAVKKDSPLVSLFAINVSTKLAILV